MGFHLSIDSPPNDDDRVSVNPGTNGSQSVVAGLWFAAYAVARRPESNRVCGWLDSYVAHREVGVRPERNRPVSVRELIAANGDDPDEPKTGCHAYDFTIALGRKMKPISDPILEALLCFYDGIMADNIGHFDVEQTKRIAEAMDLLLPHLEPSSWFENCCEIAALFHTAAECGSTVSGG